MGEEGGELSHFCAECGQPIEATGEASRKMIAAATGQAPFLRPELSTPLLAEGLPLPPPDAAAPPPRPADEDGYL